MYGNFLKNRSFFLYMLGQAVSSLGDGLYLVAFAWLSLELTNGKSIALGGIFSIYALGEIISGLISGPVVDRFSKRRLLISIDLIRSMILAIVFLLVSSNIMTLPFLYVSTFILSVLSPFFCRTEFAIVPLIVESKDLMKANGLLLGSRKLMRILSPAIGGLLIRVFGMKICFLSDTMSYLFSVLCVSLIVFDTRNMDEQKLTPKSLLRDLKSGYEIILRSRLLLIIAIYAACINFFGAPIFPLLPIVSEKMSGGVSGYGLLISAMSLGLIVSSTLTIFLSRLLKCIRIMLYGLIICAMAILTIAIGRTFLLVIISCFFMGVGLNCTNLPIQTILQIILPSEKIGVVSGFVYTIAQIAMPISMTLGGYLSQLVRIETVFLGTGIVMLAGATAGFFVPQFKNELHTGIVTPIST